MEQMASLRRGTCIFFRIKHVPVDPSGWVVFMCCSSYDRSLAFAEDLPIGFNGTSPDPVQLAKTLRIILDGDSTNGKHHKLGCHPSADPDKEFFFATDRRDLCTSVGEAMATLPNTRSSTHEVSWMPHYQSLVPFDGMWENFLTDLTLGAEKGIPWRQRLRSHSLCVGTPPEIVRVEKR